MSSDNPWTGRAALVTGAGNGIGRAIAGELAARGCHVVVNDYGTSVQGDRSGAHDADVAVEEIGLAGGSAVADRSSVAETSGAEAMVQRALDKFGRLDIVVNCAGVIRDRMSWKLTDEDWDIVQRTHLRGTFLVNRAATPHLRAGEGCHIVNFSSSAGVIGNIGSANYGAAKAGILGLTKVLALELARDGVAVNAIVPFAWTRMAQALPGQDTERVQRLRSLKSAHIAQFAAALVASNRPGWSGQIFGIRGAEVMVFSQIRPALRLARSGGWDADTLLDSGFAALSAGLVPLQSSLEIFDYDPLV